MNAQMGLCSVWFFITRIKDQGTLCVNPCLGRCKNLGFFLLSPIIRRTEVFELCLDCCNNLGCIDFLNCVKIGVETTSSSSCNLQLNQGRAHCCITVAPDPSDDGTPDLHQRLQMVLQQIGITTDLVLHQIWYYTRFAPVTANTTGTVEVPTLGPE